MTKDPPITFATKYCRMCAVELKTGVFIFGEEGKRLQIPEKIRKTLAILVLEEDRLPKKICTDCCSSLEDYAQYKDTVLDAQEKLAAIAKNLENNNVLLYESESCSKSYPAPVVPYVPASSKKSPNKGILLELEPHSEETSKQQQHHQQQHPGAGPSSETFPFKCGFCPEASSQFFHERPQVLLHISKAHLEARHKLPRFRCSECPKITEKFTALRIHTARHHPSSASSVQSGSELGYSSRSCSSASKQLAVEAHPVTKQTQVTPGKIFSCKDCGKRFNTKTGLDEHIVAKHNESPSKSSDADDLQGALSDSSLPDCMDDDLLDEPSSSSYSGPNNNLPPDNPRQRYATIDGESIENGHHHNKAVVPKLPLVFSKPDEDKDYERENQQFKKFSIAEQHTRLTEEKEKTGNKTKVWNCHVCDKVLTSNTGFHNHMMGHKGRRFGCDQCGVSYVQKATLVHHKKVHHISTPKKYKCSVCEKEFHELKFLTQHAKIHTVPSSSAEFQCHVCQKTYKTSRCLRRHVKLHTSCKKYICNFCGKGFRVKSKLDEHENSHTGKRPIGCQFCEKAFNGHPNYVKHMRRKHPSEINNRDNKIPPPKKTVSEPKLNLLEPIPTTSAVASSQNPATTTTTPTTITNNSGSVNCEPLPILQVPPVPIPAPAHNSSSSELQHQTQAPQNIYNTNISGKNFINPSGGGGVMNGQVQTSLSNSSSMNALDLVDCAIQSALVGESNNNNNNGNNNVNSNPNNTYDPNLQSQSEPMELSYKLESSAFQDMPMELTKVFQRDPLELCVRQDLNPLMDLSSRVDTSGIVSMSMNMAGVGVHKLTDLTERELMDLSGAFRQPIDLISRTEDAPHDLYNEGSLVDLSLRSTFGQDQSASSFLRELIDLSSRSDSFHGELDLTKPHQTPHNPHVQQQQQQQHHHSNGVSNNNNNNSHTTNISPKNGTGGHNVGTSLQNVVYQDAMFSLQN